MKKYFCFALTLFAAVLSFTACNRNRPENDPDDPSNGSSGGIFIDWKADYDKVAPGIYMNGNDLLAKGTDGSTFHIDDVTSLQWPGAAGGESCIPNNWHGYDGKQTTYFFWMEYYNDNDGNWITHNYEDTIFYKEATFWDKSEEMVMQARADMTYFMFIDDYQKVEDAGNFEETYIAIAKRVQVRGPIVPPSKQVLRYREISCNRWLSDYYPADMEAKKFVFKYTGGGKIMEMSVLPVFDWGKSINNPKVAWLPSACQTNDVAYVKATLTEVPEADAKAYIDKIRKEGFYSRIVTDETTEDGIMFAADSYNYYDDDAHKPAPEGGYVYPSYNVSYIKENGILNIDFEVVHVGFV